MKKDQSKIIREQAPRSATREHSVPLYLTSSFIFDSAEQGRAIFAEEEEGMVYSRYANPNTTEFINRVCVLEKADAGLAFASGMAAVFASFASYIKSGDHIVSSRAVFGSTHQLITQLFPRWGVTYTYVETPNIEDWEKAIQPNTKIVFLESPSNPGLELFDLEALAKIKEKHPHVIFAIDNCFATPYLQQPLEFGFDLSIHSATKYMDGQGRVLGGVVIGKQDLINEMMFFIRHTGPAMSAFNAWTISKSLETLPLRMDRHCENALALAEALESNPEIEAVKYPFLPSHPQYELAKKQMKGGGGIVTFEVKGGKERAFKFIDALKMILYTSNLGDSRSIATHPATTTHAKLSDAERAELGIMPGSIRLSVGLEDKIDIIEDILQALEKTK
ncbi:aminotransferase class I/II-fold pyridoxal phosphate-dependent enzyme [Empedobacter stercoris]|uniref:O-succinylhomoserine sulfhydrylase n=1 Tax=Empedobacter stercoris TaxID=1628248 RepID=A0ABX1WNX0_9FLAO|nr:aminotransferase class I/II-fold pyridoxal phosphate-dependent enzyme [Empedobacter stercoris]MCA4777146.1 aminotransferase class I/II-fold pyridoxal phosphate-dependent enzyme [Empedobacter stercoris]MCA4781029.1 aminotransferase class I/II-fold pyridoxal phosphate-dependent enzyme [Empedobacter stercoris]MCA4809968.1 aminotransferase class I/II-fold pyridoxal phosphate-dependent enzyme [Empedobacter stercoris]NOJ76231.1 aminotransferase class I/II-fold pyridoxal phosphate-dependent enzyme 